MKKKTINAVICKKFDEFVASITDEKVKNLVNKNSIITGGCITSMLLKEDINDFDVYFTNKETVLAVAYYYVNLFKESSDKSNSVPVDIFVMDGDSPKEGGIGSASFQEPGRVKIYIKSAGVAGEKNEQDYQYFESRPEGETESYTENVFNNISQTDEIPFDEVETKPKYRPVFLSANAITLSNQIQLVIRFYGEPDKIHESYDYVHCTNYWYSKDREVVLRQGALEAILSKELIYIGSKYPLCSVIRTRKFLKRGWTINAGQYLKMLFQASKLDLSDPKILEDQLVGVDAAYFSQLLSKLTEHSEKEKSEGRDFKLSYGYLATIIDKMF